MDPALRRNLQDGINAIKAGDRDRGRELLIKVVEADERIEPAWLWLSLAVDDPADRLVALENALVLNPANAEAQMQAQALRRELGLIPAEPPAEPAPATAAPARGASPVTPETPLPAITPAEAQAAAPRPARPLPPAPVVPLADDPLQCVFCGELTREDDKSCPHCRRSLLIPGQWDSRGTYRVLLVAGGVYLQGALVQNMGATIAMAVSQGMNPELVTNLARLPGVTTVLGDYLSWDPALGLALFAAAVIRAVILLCLVALIYVDSDSAPRAALFVGLLDLSWTGLALARFGFPGLVPAAFNGLLAGLVALLGASAVAAQARARLRQRAEVHRDARGALMLYKFGSDYRREGKWALAALHWRRAVALRPHEAEWYKALALAQAELKRYDAALDTLETGAQYAPQDADFKSLAEAVEARRRKRGGTASPPPSRAG